METTPTGKPIKYPCKVVGLVTNDVYNTLLQVCNKQTRYNDLRSNSKCIREIIERGIKGFYENLKENGEI